jgi:hypothetical protein
MISTMAGEGIAREGRILGPLLVLLACATVVAAGTPPRASAGTDGILLTVNLESDQSDANTADNQCDVDSGTGGNQCTLRAAIQQANAHASTDPDLIWFNIPGAGVHTIGPATELPDITGKVVIEGYSQPGASENTKSLVRGDDADLRIVLNGKDTDPKGSFGLDFVSGSGQSAVRGLVINRFSTGIRLREPTTVTGNFLGTDVTGMRDRGNSFNGIFADVLAAGSVIGGSSPEARNVISGNDDSAITSNVGMTVQGNYIGTGADGSSALGNGVINHEAAILMGGFPANHRIGGIGDAANVIAHNEGSGIGLFNSTTVVWLQRNRIYDNGDIAIDLGVDGRTPNDEGDADTGPNRLLNFPTLRKAITRGDHTTVKGTYRGFAGVDFYGIELFANPDGGRQAKRYIGSVQISTDATGFTKFEFEAERLSPGATVTATATDDGAATSELSGPVKVISG